MNEILINKTILLIDGYCNLCNSSVQFILRHERNNNIYFASLQSTIGKDILDFYKIDTRVTDSVILIDANKVYLKSTAILKVCKNLKGFYRLIYAFIIIPKFIRDWIYDGVAKRRYKWFGKQTQCIIPTNQLNTRFL
ncbi:MAG: DUF393 domain-containing protein [Bacteroidia bacterium]|nr:DUF393 domain-containing protein [Bacteroidia bacterium]